MRRWILERQQLPLPVERVTSLLVHRMAWVRTALPGDSWLDLKVRVESAGPAAAWLEVVGAYPTPRDAAGRPTDMELVREDARLRARQLLDELAQELMTVLAPLPGVEPFGVPEPPGPRVRDIMEADTAVIDEDLAAAHAAALLAAEELDGAPVVDRHGRLVGVLSERDLLGALARELDGLPEHGVTAGELCSRPALSTVPNLRAVQAAHQMLFHGVRRLAVVEDGRLVGCVTRKAVFAALRAARAPRPAGTPA